MQGLVIAPAKGDAPAMGQSCKSPRIAFAGQGKVGRRRQEEKPRSFSNYSHSRFPNKSPFSPRVSGPSRAAKGNICACGAIRKRVYFSAYSLKHCMLG